MDLFGYHCLNMTNPSRKMNKWLEMDLQENILKLEYPMEVSISK